MPLTPFSFSIRFGPVTPCSIGRTNPRKEVRSVVDSAHSMDRKPAAIQPEDYWRLRTVQDPLISPDGRWAAYWVERADQAQDRFFRALQVTDLATRQSGVLDQPGESARGLALSPDGRRLAWIADADHLSHIAIARVEDIMAGGTDPVAVQTLFEQKGLGGAVHWSPDGASVFVTRARVEASPGGIRVYHSPRVKADGAGLVDPAATELWQVALDGSHERRVMARAGAILSAALSPDGRQFAFTAAHGDDTSVFIQDVLVTDIASGETRTVFWGRGAAMLPAFSPDSRQLVFLASRGDVVADSTVAVWWVDAAGGPARDLVPDFDRPALAMATSSLRSALAASGPLFTASARAVRFLATDRGVSRLYEVELASGALTAVTPPDRCAVGQYAQSENGALLYVASDSTRPDELYWRDPAGEEHALTALNQEIQEGWHLRPAEPFTCQGADGWTVEGFLQRPPDARAHEGPHPLVLMIHGGPRGSFGQGFNFDAQVLAAQGLAVLYVNPRGSDTYGREFANAVIDDWGHKDYQDLMAAVDAAVERGIADPARLGVTGYSYGGFMSTWVIGHTDRFKAAAPGGCVTNLVSFHGTSDIGWYWGPLQHGATVWEDMPHLWAMSPLAYVQHVTTKTLLYHAERDDRCPIGQTEEFYAALKALGRDVTFVRYPDESHVGLILGAKPGLRVDVVARLARWFADEL